MQYSLCRAFAVGALAVAAGPLCAQERFTYSADGQEVSDKKTGLTWRRCAEGMTWKGKACAGQAIFFTQPDAAARAKAAGGEWRLPELKEMSSIVALRELEPGKTPPVDPVAFAGTPMSRFWTSSSNGPGYFNHVAFSDGSAGESPRNSPGAVRLVRVGAP